jgi:hypothetical protein
MPSQAGACGVIDCGRRAMPFLGCALREQRKLPTPLHHTLQTCSFSLQGWGLIDLPLRASNEGLLRPRVARAQEINRLRPLLCPGSTGPTWVSFQSFLSCAFREQEDDQAALPSLLILLSLCRNIPWFMLRGSLCPLSSANHSNRIIL